MVDSIIFKIHAEPIDWYKFVLSHVQLIYVILGFVSSLAETVQPHILLPQVRSQ